MTVLQHSVMNVFEICPGLLEKRARDVRCEWMFQHQASTLRICRALFVHSVAYPRMFLLLVNLALMRKLSPYFNFELPSLKMKVYICRNVT